MNNNPRPIILGSYSPSQNGIIVSPHGIALCIAGGGKGHDGREAIVPLFFIIKHVIYHFTIGLIYFILIFLDIYICYFMSAFMA